MWFHYLGHWWLSSLLCSMDGHMQTYSYKGIGCFGCKMNYYLLRDHLNLLHLESIFLHIYLKPIYIITFILKNVSPENYFCLNTWQKHDKNSRLFLIIWVYVNYSYFHFLINKVYSNWVLWKIDEKLSAWWKWSS